MAGVQPAIPTSPKSDLRGSPGNGTHHVHVFGSGATPGRRGVRFHDNPDWGVRDAMSALSTPIRRVTLAGCLPLGERHWGEPGEHDRRRAGHAIDPGARLVANAAERIRRAVIPKQLGRRTPSGSGRRLGGSPDYRNMHRVCAPIAFECDPS